MARTQLFHELVETPDKNDGGYYDVTVTLSDDKSDEGTATLPDGIGKVRVFKQNYQYPEPHQSFAWKIKKEDKKQ